MAHTVAWQRAYEGIVPQDFLDGIDVERRAEQWHQNVTESVLPNGTPSPTNYVAEVDDQVIGFACVGVFRESRDDSSLAELWAIYVHPDHWGSGAGYALEQQAIAQFRQDSVKTAYLWVLEDNELARRFYERQGWQADDATQTEDIGGTAIVERRYSINLA